MIPSTVVIFGDSGATGGLAASIDDRTVSKSKFVGPTTASYNFGSLNVTDQDNVLLEQWLDNGHVTDFEVKADLLSGTSPSGSSLGTFISVSPSAWSLTATGNQTVTCQIQVQIRDAVTHVVLTSAKITITAISHS